jgi:parvulin-like peptidyl-prolyl isomerase
MRKVAPLAMLLALLALGASGAARAQQVVDRIVARIEGDIILLSDVEKLSHYQKFLDGKSQSNEEILQLLIDQWVVRTEAETSRFPAPSPADVQRNVDRVKKSFASPAEYEARKDEAGLTDAEISEMAGAQLYLSNYLDSRFRPAVQIDAKAIEDYYQTGVVARAKARGVQPPTFEAARDLIQEFLVQQGINDEANRWLKESRNGLHVENLLNEDTP